MSSQRGAESPSRTTFGKYQLIAALGSGGMADVYLAVAQGPARFNKLVVLKCLRKRWLDEEGAEDGPRTDKGEFVEMFLEEARLAARLNHPNIVQTNEVGEEQGDYFIAMEYLEGQSLNRLMNRCWRKEREIPLELAILVLCDTLAGLHHAHELSDYDGKALEIVHRDASPHNIFVTYEGQTKLVDFGIAKATNRSFETRTGILKGKIQYMAPEQARCGDVDRRADIFSIGVILWELLAKKRMWGGLPDIQILQKLVTEPVPKLEDVAPNAPAGLVKIVEKATASDANDRFATADEMRLELYNWAKVNLPPSTSKEMGTLTAELFADKRQMVKGIIENQFAQIRRGEDISLHVMDPNASTQSLPKATGDLGESETSHPSHSGSRKGATGSGSPTLSSVARTNSESFAPGPRKRTGLWVALGVLAIGGVAVAATVGSKDPGTVANASASDKSPAPPASTQAPAPAPSPTHNPAATPAPAGTEKSNLTKLSITVNVEDAKIYIDDVQVTGNPYVGNFTRDGANHRVRAEADGYVTEKRLIPFDAGTKDVTIELSAKPGTTPRPLPRYVPKTQPSAVATAPTATTPPTSTGGPGKPPKRELDKTTDPWATPKP